MEGVQFLLFPNILLDQSKSIVSRFLADLNAFRISTAQITYDGFFADGMQMWNLSWARLYTKAAAYTRILVDDNSTSPFINRECIGRARLYAGIVIALCAEMGNLYARKGHKDAYSRSFGPHTPFMVE